MNETLLIASLLLAFFVVCIFFESIVLALLGIAGWLRSLGQAAIVNACTIILLFVLWPLLSRLNVDEDRVFPMLPILFLSSVALEAVVLKRLNRQHSWKHILMAAALMNVVSYGMLYVGVALFL
jgi:hypothetical protein